jgi:hypothetical protein
VCGNALRMSAALSFIAALYANFWRKEACR